MVTFTAALLLFLIGILMVVADHYLHFSCHRELLEKCFDNLYKIKWFIIIALLIIIYKVRKSIENS